MFKLIETKDFKSLTDLFFRSGLEIAVGAEPPAGLIKCFEIIEVENGKRAGAMSLEKRAGEFVLADMAVEEEYRHRKLGTMMLEKAIAEIREMGGKRIMLVAKVPDFYRPHGFTTMDMDTAPVIFKCKNCSDYNIVCHPEVMYLDLG